MLHQLSGFSTPPFPSIPLHVHAITDSNTEMKGLSRVAPNAHIESGATGFLGPDNENKVAVLDRCSRLVYTQPLLRSDVNFKLLRAAILSAHHGVCGPCILDSQSTDLNNVDSVLETTTEAADEQPPVVVESQRKISDIVRGYKADNVANLTVIDAVRDVEVEIPGDTDQLDSDAVTNTTLGVTDPTVVEERRDIDENVKKTDVETVKIPKRRINKNKRKERKLRRQEKRKNRRQKKRKRVLEDKGLEDTNEGVETTTVMKEMGLVFNEPNVSNEDPRRIGEDIERDMDNVVDEGENLIGVLEGEYMGVRSRSEGAVVVSSTEPTTVTTSRSRVVWPLNRRERRRRKNRNRKEWNTKEDHRDFQIEMEEGVELAEDDTDLVAHPDDRERHLEGDRVSTDTDLQDMNLMTNPDDEMEDSMEDGMEDTIVEGDIILDVPNAEDDNSLDSNEPCGESTEDRRIDDKISESEMFDPIKVRFGGKSVQDRRIDDIISESESEMFDPIEVRLGGSDDYVDVLVEESTGEGKTGTEYEQGGSKRRRNRKKYRGKSRKSTKRGRKKKQRDFKPTEELEEEMNLENGEDVGEVNFEPNENVGDVMDKWVEEEQVDSREFAPRSAVDTDRSSENAMDDSEESGKQFATRNEAAVVPAAYDPGSRSDSTARRRHVVYKWEDDSRSKVEREGEDNDRAVSHHSKVMPWTNDKY